MATACCVRSGWRPTNRQCPTPLLYDQLIGAEIPPRDEAKFRELRRVEAQFNGTGRVLIRYSGTEPLLRIMVEGSSAAAEETAARSLARVAGG